MNHLLFLHKPFIQRIIEVNRIGSKGLNRPNWTLRIKVDQKDRSRPEGTEMDQIDRSRLNWTEINGMDRSGLRCTKIDGSRPN